MGGSGVERENERRGMESGRLTFWHQSGKSWAMDLFPGCGRPSQLLLCFVTLLGVLIAGGLADGDEIHDAARAGDLAKLQALLKADPHLVFSKNGAGETPLLAAAESKHDDAVSLLLANKADVNAADVFGMTALHHAVIDGNKELAGLLIANKADVNARDQNGLTPLYETGLMGRAEIAELLLDHGADINAAGKEGTFWAGDTPLYMAACNGNGKVVKVLLTHHADLNAKGKDGLTPLEIAIKNHHDDVAGMLRNPANTLANEAPPPPPRDGVAPEEVVARLVADAGKTPPGPVENDVTSDTVQACEGLIKMMGDKRSPREALAATYDTFTLQGPVTSFYAKGSGALYSGAATLTKAALKNYAENPDESSEEVTVGGKVVSRQTGPTVMFGPLVCDFIDAKVPADGKVVANFCLVQQQGIWKVHCVYFSTDPLHGDNRDFIVGQLADFANKQR
jgi:hypothetical protein